MATASFSNPEWSNCLTTYDILIPCINTLGFFLCFLHELSLNWLYIIFTFSSKSLYKTKLTYYQFTYLQIVKGHIFYLHKPENVPNVSAVHDIIWLFVWCLTSLLGIFQLYDDITFVPLSKAINISTIVQLSLTCWSLSRKTLLCKKGGRGVHTIFQWKDRGSHDIPMEG